MRYAVLDYCLEYELLHYQYNRWLFETVTDVINNTFSQQYWQSQHSLLIDAVRQFGYPTLFLTLSHFK